MSSKVDTTNRSIDVQSDEARRQLLESVHACRKLVEYAETMQEYPEFTKAAMDRMLAIIQVAASNFILHQSDDEARRRDMEHYKLKNSSPSHEAQIAHFKWMKEQSELAERREKAATNQLDDINKELAVAKKRIEELERDAQSNSKTDQDIGGLQEEVANLELKIENMEANEKVIYAHCIPHFDTGIILLTL